MTIWKLTSNLEGRKIKVIDRTIGKTFNDDDPPFRRNDDTSDRQGQCQRGRFAAQEDSFQRHVKIVLVPPPPRIDLLSEKGNAMKAREESKGEVWKRDSSSRPLRNKREDDSFLDRCCSNDPQTRQLSVSKDGRVSFLLEIVHDREREECRPPSQPEGPFDSFITSVITRRGSPASFTTEIPPLPVFAFARHRFHRWFALF